MKQKEDSKDKKKFEKSGKTEDIHKNVCDEPHSDVEDFYIEKQPVRSVKKLPNLARNLFRSEPKLPMNLPNQHFCYFLF